MNRTDAEVIAYAAYLVCGGVYGAAGDMEVEIRQNRSTFEAPNYSLSELLIVVRSLDNSVEEMAIVESAQWRAALAVALSA